MLSVTDHVLPESVPFMWTTIRNLPYVQGPVVQSPIQLVLMSNLWLTLNKTYGANPGLALIGL